MRSLRQVLRLTLALQALFAFVAILLIALRHPRFHLAQNYLVALVCFISWLGLMAGIAALRINRDDQLGRWSLLAASIFNIVLFPVGTALGAAGIFYFVRNPPPDPVFDRRHRPIAGDGTSQWSGAIFTAAQIVWGIFILSSIRRWTVAQGMPQIHSETLFWITLACAIYSSTFFHELGHMIFGDIVGFRLIGVGVGPLTWAYSGGRWRVRMRYDKLLGGHTAMVPSTPQNIRGRAMILTLGGPLASLAVGAIGIICLLLIPGSAWPASLGRMVALIAGFAAGDFIFNLMPMASEAQYSDGARLWQMLRRGPWCDFHCANHYMGLSQTTTLRPRDWPTAMVERAAEFAAQLPEPAGSFAMAYAHYLDRCDWAHALSWLEKAHLTARPGSKLADALTVDRAYIEAFHRRDGREAQRWFEQAPRRDDSTDYWRSAAAVRAAQGDLSGASEAWSKAWDLAEKRPPTGIYDMDREQIRMVGTWLEQLRSQPISA